MFGKKEENYFDMFKGISGTVCRAALKMQALICDYTDVERRCREIEDLEHTADKQVYRVYEQLNRSFITPIDREDILLVAKRLDQVIDQIDSAAQRFLMYNVERMTDESKTFSRLIVECCETIDGVVTEFKHFKKAKRLHEGIRKVNELEHQGDDHYHATVRKLFRENNDALTVIKWKEMYQALERILDVCEDAVNTISSVVMKNS